MSIRSVKLRTDRKIKSGGSDGSGKDGIQMVTYPSDWRTYPLKKFFTLTAMDEEIEALEIERDKIIQIREGAMDDLLTGRVRLSI